jgi:hypothetical protein
MIMKVTLATEISNSPLYKIFEGVPARSNYYEGAKLRHIEP